jgi:hypothetical protein
MSAQCVALLAGSFLTGVVVGQAQTPSNITKQPTTGGRGIGQDDPRPHFGLGDAQEEELLRIEWPSGTVQELTGVTVGQLLTVTELARLEMNRAGELAVRCWEGQAFRVERSLDLKAWTPLLTLTNTLSPLPWNDTNPKAEFTRFCRVVYP